MIDITQLHQLAGLLKAVSDIEIMPRFRQLQINQIEEKLSHHDLVTVADQAAEIRILDQLRVLYPDALLIGEESVYDDPTVLNKYSDASLCFILDPIDGTWHYANGSINFGMMLGIACKGEMIGGIIFEPVTGDYLWAIKGQGAYQHVNGTDQPLTAGRHDALPLTETMCCYSFGVTKQAEREQALRAANKMGRIMDYRCAAAEYRFLNTGAVSYVIFQNKLNLWDHGAGLLISKEAGAVARMIDGSEYTPQVTGKLLVAESEARWQEVAKLFG